MSNPNERGLGDVECDNCGRSPCKGAGPNQGKFKVGDKVRPTEDAARLLTSVFPDRAEHTVIEVVEIDRCSTTGQHIKTDAHDGWSDVYWWEFADALLQHENKEGGGK